MMFCKNRTTIHLLVSAALLLSLNADSEDGCSDEVRVPRNTKYEVFQGEELRIGCPVVFCSQTPPTVFWYKVEEAQIQINPSSSRGIKIVWVPTNESVGTSFLVFEKIHRNNSGLYRCGMKGTVGHSIRVQVYGPNGPKTITTKTTNQTPEENPELSTVTTRNGPLTEPACSDLCCQNFYRTLGVLAFFLVLTAVCFTSKRCYKGRSRTRTDPSLQMF
ncbi:uncharacterized protein btla [Oryzias latipes]